MLGSVPQLPVLSTKSIWDEMRNGEVNKCEIGCKCYISKWSRNSFKRHTGIFVCVRLLTCQPVLDFSLVQQTRMRRHLRIKLPERFVKWAILHKYFEKDGLIFLLFHPLKKPKNNVFPLFDSDHPRMNQLSNRFPLTSALLHSKNKGNELLSVMELISVAYRNELEQWLPWRQKFNLKTLVRNGQH